MASIPGIGSATNPTTSPVNFTGLASGLDTTSIINGITAIETQYIQQLTQRQTGIQNQQTAFGTISSSLQALQTATQALTQTVSSPFAAFTATSSNPAVLTAAASSSASTGQYTLTVGSLAFADVLSSQGLASPTTQIKQGTLTLQAGSSPAVTITVDSSNDTLQGLAKAINSANAGITASIINDGSATPYRLLLTSNKTGVANDIQVNNNLNQGNGAAIDPANTTVQPGTDARVTIGSGSGAVTITSPTNTIDGVVPGVAINVLQASPNQPVTLTVAADPTAAVTAVQNFVTAYNAVIDFINQNDSYNSNTQTAGLLLGNFTVGNLAQTLGDTVTQAVSSVNPALNDLSAIGVTIDQNGDLQFDSSQLQNVINGQVPGVAATDVQALFGLTGTSTNPGVSFVVGSDNTKPTNGTPYQVQATQAATQGALTATNALSGTTTIDNTNNVFSLNVNGQDSGPLTIAAGSYTPDQLATAIQDAVNSDSKLGGAQVSVGVVNNQLQITSLNYGSISAVAIGTGSAITSGILGFTGSESGRGRDVAGYFLVNGKIETATGFGQILSGNSGNANTDGLQVKVTLNQSQITSTPEASLSVTEGVAQQLNQVLKQYLTPGTGTLATVNTQYTSQVTAIGKQITDQNSLLQSEITNLQEKFNLMETTLNTLNTLSQQLSTEFASIAGNWGTANGAASSASSGSAKTKF